MFWRRISFKYFIGLTSYVRSKYRKRSEIDIYLGYHVTTIDCICGDVTQYSSPSTGRLRDDTRVRTLMN
jgi:hypothetical protein